MWNDYISPDFIIKKKAPVTAKLHTAKTDMITVERFTTLLIQFYRREGLKEFKERVSSQDRGLVYEGGEVDVPLWDSSTFMSAEGDLNLQGRKRHI